MGTDCCAILIGIVGSLSRVAAEENPGQEQQECDVDPYRGARNRADIE
jgi:hypothetical protein